MWLFYIFMQEEEQKLKSGVDEKKGKFDLIWGFLPVKLETVIILMA